MCLYLLAGDYSLVACYLLIGVSDHGVKIKKKPGHSSEMDQIEVVSVCPVRIFAVLDKHACIQRHRLGLSW